MEKRISSIFVLILSLISFSKGEDFNELVNNLVDKVVLGLDFSSLKTVCVFEFDNLTPRSPAFLQSVYQLFLATLEKKLKENIVIEDEVVGFDENIGYFNFSEDKVYDYLFSLTYSEREGRVSLSLKVFNGKEPSKIIAFFYSSLLLNPEEIELIEKPISRQFSFISPIYEPVYLPFSPLDVRFFNENKLIFLTKDRLMFYDIEGERLKLSDTINLDWGKPIFPSLDLTGRIYFELNENTRIILADSSLSTSVLIFSLKEGQWNSEIPLGYIPVGKITIGNRDYLLCVKTREGMNGYKEKIALIHPSAIISENAGGILRELELVPFYDILPINDEKGRFFGIYIVDANGKLRFYNRNFRELKIPEMRVGDKMISIGNYFLCSKFGRDENDSILVMSIKERNILQEAPLKGSVISMTYNGSDTIAVLCRDINSNYFLHFWRKK